MVMRDIGSFHYPKPRFISRGAAEGNKHGKGGMVTAYIPKSPYLKDKYPNFEVGLKCILTVNPYLLVCSYIK